MENIENNEKKEYYAFPEDLMPTLEKVHNIYEIIKRNLCEVDMEWLKEEGRHSVIVDLKLDLIYLLSFLGTMSGSPDEFPLYIAEMMFCKDPPANYAIGFIKAAENMKIDPLLYEYKITPEVTKHFDEFTSNVTNTLLILPQFNDHFKLSMIYYLYGTLITALCKMMESHASSPIILTGINNYLKTQFDVIGKQLTDEDAEQFYENVFPYLQHTNDRIHDIERAVNGEPPIVRGNAPENDSSVSETVDE